MCRNGFRKRPVTIKILTLAGKPAVLKIKKQQYLCPPSPQCPKVAEIQRVNFACRIANVVKYHIATPCRCKAQFFPLWLRSRFLVFPIFPNIRICRYVGKKV